MGLGPYIPCFVVPVITAAFMSCSTPSCVLSVRVQLWGYFRVPRKEEILNCYIMNDHSLTTSQSKLRILKGQFCHCIVPLSFL